MDTKGKSDRRKKQFWTQRDLAIIREAITAGADKGQTYLRHFSGRNGRAFRRNWNRVRDQLAKQAHNMSEPPPQAPPPPCDNCTHYNTCAAMHLSCEDFGRYLQQLRWNVFSEAKRNPTRRIYDNQFCDKRQGIPVNPYPMELF